MVFTLPQDLGQKSAQKSGLLKGVGGICPWHASGFKGLKGFQQGFWRALKRCQGLFKCCFLRFFRSFSFFLRPVVLYTVLMVFPSLKPWPKFLSKTWQKKIWTKFVRQIDRYLPEKRIKNFQSTSLKLFPSTRKLQINQSAYRLRVYEKLFLKHFFSKSQESLGI